jgi:hypothetical protein
VGDTMRFEFTPTPEEYLHFAVLKQRLAARKNAGSLAAYLGYGATSLGLLLLLERPDGGGWVAPASLILVGTLVLCVVYRPFNIIRWKKEHDRLIGPIIVEFGDDGVTVTSELYRYSFAWRYYIRWMETR